MVGARTAHCFMKAVLENDKAGLQQHYEGRVRAFVVLSMIAVILMYITCFSWNLIIMEIVFLFVWIGIERHLCKVVKAWN
jgi:hypothetical protein